MSRRCGFLRWTLSSLPLLLGVACTENREPLETVAVRDSAGVQIVQFSRIAWEGFPLLQLSSSARLSIGAVEGSDDEILYRVSGGAVLEDGRVAILNGGSRELRFYGTDGTLMARQGRTGDGPGEYRQPGGLWNLPGDTIVVWDRRLLRVSVVGPDGLMIRETSVRGRPMATQIMGAFADGSLLLFQQRSAEEQRAMDQQFMGYYSRLSPLGDSLNALGEFPWRRLITTPPTETGGGLQLVESGPPVFDAETEIAATGDGLWVGTTKSDEVLWLNSSGEVKRVLRWAGADRSVTDRVKEAYYAELRDRLAAAAPDGRVREVPKNQVFADILPAHGDLVARADAGLWMQDYAGPGSSGVNAWRIFSPKGLPEARITLPSGARVLWAGVGRVLLLESDQFDVEYVRLYSLEPGTDAR